jgi:DNA polymerase-3 subunit delta'
MARGKASADASELQKLEWPHDWPPPWRNDHVLGHDAAEHALLAAHKSGRLHHAWLIAGPRGIGKATLAWRFARYLLAGQAQAQGGLFGGSDADSLDVAIDAPGRSLVDARSHPDLFHLRRTVHPDTGRMRAEIAVEDVRDLGAFMHMTPAMGQWRVAIVDAADEMTRNAANAVLKILEEPPPKAVLLIVTHAPGRLLPTIRSRCRRLSLLPLSDDVMARLLSQHAPAVSAEEGAVLARLSDGSIGRALDLASAGSLDLYRDMVDVLATLPELDIGRLHGFAERFARRGEEANAAWRALNYLLDGWLKGLARRAALGGQAAAIVPAERGLQARLLAAASLDRWIGAWEKAADLLSSADRINLDRKQTVLASFLALQSAMR